MLNRITIAGRLTRDPELKQTTSGTLFTKITLAVERNYKDKDNNKITDFISAQMWKKQAEYMCVYFNKGDMVIVDGSLKNERWQDDKGEKRDNWIIEVEHIYGISTTGNGATAGKQESMFQTPSAPPPTQTGDSLPQGFVVTDSNADDDDLPF